MKTIILSLLLTVSLFSCQESVSPNDPENIWRRHNSGGGSLDTNADRDSDSDNTTDAPIDGGLSILLIAGAAYGAKRVRSNKQKQKSA
jgi:hypothetical protein